VAAEPVPGSRRSAPSRPPAAVEQVCETKDEAQQHVTAGIPPSRRRRSARVLMAGGAIVSLGYQFQDGRRGDGITSADCGSKTSGSL
jgi:hypothetical protein